MVVAADLSVLQSAESSATDTQLAETQINKEEAKQACWRLYEHSRNHHHTEV